MRPRSLLLAATALAVGGAPALRAQIDVWNLPPRGAAEYDRLTHALYVIPRVTDARGGVRWVIRGADGPGQEWRFRQFRAGLGADGYEQPDYDDSGWATGRTPFGDRPHHRTAWPGDERFLDVRTRFELGRRMPKAAVLSIGHDDNAVVYLNGVEIYRKAEFLTGVTVALTGAALDAFVPGENVLVARIENTGGASHFDLALTTCDRAFRDPQAAVRLVREEVAAARRSAGLFPPFRAPRYLCEGQLDKEKEKVERPPLDLRDLPAFIAFDLSRARLPGSTSGVAPRMYRFGDVGWRGRTGPPDGTGLQTIQVELESEEAALRGDDKRYVTAYVRGPHAYTHALRGTLTIERRIDPDRGAVAWFRARLSAQVSPLRGTDAGRTFDFGFDEEWTLKRIRKTRDLEFDTAVIEAIQRGAKKLKAEIRNPKRNVLKNQAQGRNSHNTGRLALSLLALLHAEVPHDDPVIQKGLAALRKRRLVDTYSTAHAIMAMEKYYAPRGELEELRAGTIVRPRQRQPTAEDRELLEEWTRILLRNVDSRVDRGYLLRFNYTPAGRYDNSVNQYGLLGLYSAHLCGVEIPVTVWEAAANHLIDDQERPSGRVRLELKTYRQVEAGKHGGTTTTTGSRAVKPAGWGYQSTRINGLRRPVYGAMTCAGIGGLTICLAGIRDSGVTRTELTAAAERAVLRGFAWLAENFSVHSNVSRVHQPYYWVYYYLYGLERACELSGVALINDRDWYYEGALTLIEAQHADGGWPADHRVGEVMERTAMAVLFLKKSSMPVYTR